MTRPLRRAGTVPGDAHKAQHTDLWRKVALRKRLCSSALPGPAYVPFIGEGDIAAELYGGRTIYGADLDPGRVKTARGRFASCDIRVADCDGWPFPDVRAAFAIADFDAYGNPYHSLAAFWARAAKADRVVLFGTDGLRIRVKRERVIMRLPDGRETASVGQAFREQYNFWWPRYVLPYLTGLVAPRWIARSSFYLGGHSGEMLYWGVVVE